eukprot:851517_1
MDAHDREKEHGFLSNLRAYVEVNNVIGNDVVQAMDTNEPRPSAIKRMVSLEMAHGRAESSIGSISHTQGIYNVRNVMKGSVSITSQHAPNVVAMEDSDSDREGLFEEADMG